MIFNYLKHSHKNFMEDIKDLQLLLLGTNREINLPLPKIMSNYGISMHTEFRKYNRLNLMKIQYNR
jgi:hypothetical protein